MATNTQIQVYIGGKHIPAFKSLKLQQEIDAHHDFEITCRRDVLETLTDDISSESINFLGEVFLLKIQSTNGFSDDEVLEFKQSNLLDTSYQRHSISKFEAFCTCEIAVGVETPWLRKAKSELLRRQRKKRRKRRPK